MYFLDRLKPELSANEEGTAPNERFQELYEKVKRGENISPYITDKFPLAV